MKNRNMINRLLRAIALAMTLLPVFCTGCKEEGRIDYIDSNGPAPAQLSRDQITVRNTHGGAVLTYTVPSDKNLLYVRAEYEIKPGVMREGMSSVYTDSLVLEGFGDTRTYDVNLYSVGKNGKASEPVTVQINPLTPPVHLATKLLKETFGGVNISITNPKKANLAIVLMGDTANMGHQSTLQTFYTSKESASFNFRGLDTIPADYSVYLRDRWYNLSDTAEANLTPWFEMEIPYTKWTEYFLPGDHPENAYRDGTRLRNLWNNNWTEYISNCVIGENLRLPCIMTISMGETVMMSRFQCWPRAYSGDMYERGHAKLIELWGSMEPNPNGELDESWTPLGRLDSEGTASGGAKTSEDIQACLYPSEKYSVEMEESEFSPDPFTPFKYLRIVTRTTFASNTQSYVMFQGIKIHGTPVK